jgi:uncharacterized protein
VSKLSDPFLLNVGFIAHQSIGYRRDFDFDFVRIFLPPDLDLQNPRGIASVSRTSEGLLVQVKISTSVQTTCVRCLEDCIQPLRIDFTELYTFASHAQPSTELIYPENGQIDLGTLIREYLTIEIPISPICKIDCKGLCPVCGENLNITRCNHEPESNDPRLSMLKSLLDEE